VCDVVVEKVSREGGGHGCWGENLPRRGANGRNELKVKKAKENTYDTEERKTRTQLGVMQPRCSPIAPFHYLQILFIGP
jgi:hypothetical protein